MKIEDQVLSIEQVQELQELGFDVRKHASLYFVEEKHFKNIVLPEQIDITRVPEDVKITPTMTIGDIIDILPIFIEIGSSQITHKLGINNSNIQYFNNNNIFIRFENNTQIYRLFQCLKWCIKEKHIKL